ncbi:MAG: ribosome maturation factor RimM [Oceanococcus sp.]
MPRPKSGDWITLGQIRGVFGVKGWLRLESFTDPAENILDYARWRVSTPSGHRFMRPQQGRWHGPGLIVQLATEDGGVIADREGALGFVHAEVSVERDELPQLDDDEIYWSDLVGMQVFGLENELLGTVSTVVDNPAHPILQLAGETSLLIPFVRGPIVESVDKEANAIRVHWSSDYAV